MESRDAFTQKVALSRCSEVSIREGPEELTLRTEEVGSKKKKACINVDHIAEDR